MDETKQNKMPMLGEKAPPFQAKTTQSTIDFPDEYAGKWIVFFSHPGDFTPVCTTEFMVFANMAKEFDALNTQLVGLSVDSTPSHIAWLRTIRQLVWNQLKNINVTFPLIADSRMDIAKKYGMIHEKSSNTETVRAVFLIDPHGIIRAILYYPLTTGRNMNEIKRMIQALQLTDRDHVSTPANWQPGEDVVLPAPKTLPLASERLANQDHAYACLDWFLCFQKAPKEEGQEETKKIGIRF